MQADCAVMEAGLGGEKDATNITQPSSVALSIITPLGLEHQDVLGEGPAHVVLFTATQSMTQCQGVCMYIDMPAQTAAMASVA